MANRILSTHRRCHKQVVQRVLSRHAFSRDMADMLIRDYTKCVKYYEERLVRKPLTKKKAADFTTTRR